MNLHERIKEVIDKLRAKGVLAEDADDADIEPILDAWVTKEAETACGSGLVTASMIFRQIVYRAWEEGALAGRNIITDHMDNFKELWRNGQYSDADGNPISSEEYKRRREAAEIHEARRAKETN